MRGTAAVAANEIREKSFIFAGAILAGFLPIAIALLGPSAQRSDVREMAALVLAGAVGGVLALILGSASIGAELAERRMGFFFSRPLSSFAIWAGKTLAAALLVVGSTSLVVLPAALAGGGLRSLAGHREIGNLSLPRIRDWQLVLIGAAALVAFLAFSQAAGIAFRSRSRWIAIDALALAVTLGAAFDAGRRLLLARATVCLVIGSVAFLLGVVLSVPVACFIAVRTGRVSLVRTHRWLSLMIWGLVLPMAAGIEAYSGWVISPRPSGLRRGLAVTAAGGGPWVAASGVARGRFDYDSRFLLNTANGDFLRLADSYWFQRSIAFNEPGTRAVWVEPDGERLDLFSADLASRPLRKTATRISFKGRAPGLVVSRDGNRVATLDGFNVAVIELPGGRIVSSVNVPRKERSDIANIDSLGCRATFVGPDRLRIYALQPSDVSAKARDLEIYELDLTWGKLTKTGEAAFDSVPLYLTDSTAERLLVRELSKREITLRDAKTGDRRAILAPEGTSGRWADFLSDGRIALVESRDGKATATIFAGSGDQEKTLELGAGYRPHFREIEPGRLIFEIDPEKLGSEKPKHALLELETGASRPVRAGIFADRWSRWWGSDPAATPRPGSLATRLFHEGPKEAIVELDPETGARRTIIPGK